MILFDHGDNIVHMGKTIAQKGAHVVNDGIRRKTAVGETTKAYFCNLYDSNEAAP